MGLDDALKERELEILHLIADGLTDAEIAERLFLAKDTVRWYNKQIYSKLDVHNRTEAVSRAREQGLFEQEKLSNTPTIKKSPIHYVKNDALHIAYQVVGEGEKDLLFMPGFVSHLEVTWEEPQLKRYFERLATTHRLILFDKRGMGLSDKIEAPITLENMISDACAVMNAVGSEQALLMGVSEGGAATLLFAATYPERVKGLIIYGATPKFVRDGNEPKFAMPPEAFEHWIDMMEREWGGPYGIELFAPSRMHESDFRDWWAKFLRMAASPGSVFDVFRIIADIDVRHVLPSIYVPTLVLHRTGDQMIYIDAGRYIAEQMPNATFVEINGSDHLFWVNPDTMLDYIEHFSQSLEDSSQPEYILTTVLNACFDSAVSHDSVKSVILHFQGRIIKQNEDSLTAIFDGPSRAIRCAKNLFSSHKHAKFSLHTGECRIQGDAIMGTALTIAAQICEQSEIDTIIVSRTIRDLIAGSGINLDKHGYLELDDFQLPLYIVR